jgi:hypothetical protein
MGCKAAPGFSHRFAIELGVRRTENKKGPPFGEPFLILRMVPAPDERFLTVRAEDSRGWNFMDF